MENVLITGTTSGIGKAFAEKFASMGNNIILVSRDRQKLEQQQLYLQSQYHVTVTFIAYDLSKEDAVDLIMKQIYNWNIPVDFLAKNFKSQLKKALFRGASSLVYGHIFIFVIHIAYSYLKKIYVFFFYAFIVFFKNNRCCFVFLSM